MRQHGLAPVQPDGLAEVHGENEIDHGPRRQSQGLYFEKYTHG
jgi:hypothetical protein